MSQTDDPQSSFIDTLVALRGDGEPQDTTLGAIVDRLDERAFGILILLLTLPCLVPGLPGAQLIAIPIILLAAQLMLGRSEPWLPARILSARVKGGWVQGVAGFADKRLRWTERLSGPRLTFLATGLGEKITGLGIVLAGITIALPITNTIPSLAITVASVGLIQRDGVFTLVGTVLGLAWVTGLVVMIAALFMGAGFAVSFVQEHAPWLSGLVGSGS